MRIPILLTSSLLLLTFSFAPRAFALPHYGDPNQAYDQMPGTYETPHVKWATPLAGGRLKALVALPYNMAREAIELRERVDLDLTVVMTQGREKRSGSGVPERNMPLGGVESVEVVDRLFRERLLDRSKHYDVIVIGKVAWSVFKPAEQAEIVRRVRDGAGLVWYEPKGSGADFDALVGAGDEAFAAELLRGYPLEVFPVVLCKTLAEMKASYAGTLRRSALRAPLRIRHASLGKGRVVSLDSDDWNASDTVFGYTFDNRAAEYQREVSGYDYTVYEYHYALAARAILMATGRDANALELELPKTIARSELEKSPLIARVAMLDRETRDERRDDRVSGLASQGSGSRLSSQVSRPSSLILEIRPRRAPHGAPAVYEREEPIRTARDSRAGSGGGRAREVTSTTVSFNLPVLPAGVYLASVRLRDAQGDAIDFATAAFEVTSDVSLKIATKRDRYPAGTTIEGTVTPSRALKDGERIVVKAVDTWGRVVFLGDAVSHRVNKDENSSSGTRQDAASTKDDKFHSPTPTLNSNYTFSIPVVSPLSRLWDLESEICDSQGEVAKARTWVGIPNWTFDDYMTMLIFAPSPDARTWKGDYHADLMRREAGVNATFSSLIYGYPEQMELNERHHLQSVAYVTHYGESTGADDSHAAFKKPNAELDLQAAVEMLEAYTARGCTPQSAKEFPYSQRGLHVGEFNSMLPIYRYVGKFGTPFYSTTMENYLAGEFYGTECSGFGPRTTRAFQRWCRREYGDDIAKLNAEWNTSFKSFDEVSGIMMTDAVLADQTSRWVDFRYFMRSKVWGGFFLALEKHIHAIDPHLGRVGMGGHDQHDYTQYRGDTMTSGKLYVAEKEDWEWADAIEIEIRQSFAKDRGWWLGSQSVLYWQPDLCDPIKRQRNPWTELFLGLQGFDYENGLNGESLGGGTWCYPDYSGLLPFAKDLAREVRVLERGIGKLVLAAKPHRAPVAISWSPRNHYISRLHPEQPRGFTGTWLYNITLVGGAPNDALCLMNSLRMRPTFVAPGDGLDGCRALWLPYNKGMDETEAEAIRAFVKAGGLVLADNEPGVYTRHGKPRAERLLKDLFPDFSRVTVTACGKGHAAYLAGKLNCYPDRMLRGDFGGADLVAGLLEKYAGVMPALGLKGPDGADVRNVRFTEFDLGGTRLVGLLRPHKSMQKNDSADYTLDLGGEYDVYDVTRGSAYLGRHAKMALALDHYAKMLALVPAKIEGAKLACEEKVKVKGEGEEKVKGKGEGEQWNVSLNLTISTSQPLNPSTSQLPLADAWHLEVFGPDGAELECYRNNYVVKGTSCKLTLPIALNAAKGTYRARMTSAVSGVKAETAFAVK